MNKGKKEIERFQTTVLTHYREHGRHNLPWRRTQDPYAILVSEIMLQQTQVDRVVPYFVRLIARFPTVESLARARLSEVLRLWSGLGYNRRARLLRECAREIVEKHGGRVPKGKEELVALPGIGPYTAGAIRAFAFNEPDIFIETNIRSALIHHFFPDTITVHDRELQPYVATSLKGQEPRVWYAALMDYGAQIKKTNPNPSRRSKHHMVQANFEGSMRQVRGAIIRRLLSGSITEESVRSINAKDAYQISMALRSLEKEGLIERKGKAWRLPKN